MFIGVTGVIGWLKVEAMAGTMQRGSLGPFALWTVGKPSLGLRKPITPNRRRKP